MKRKKTVQLSLGIMGAAVLVVAGVMAARHPADLREAWHRLTGKMPDAQAANGRAGTTPASGSEEDAGPDKYQCSMHPNIVSDQAGTCPICAMDLQPVTKVDARGISGRSPVKLDLQQRQLINIRTVRVRQAEASRTLRTVGILQHDASKVFTVSAWTDGHIKELFVDKPEIDVRKGDLLYSIYSPELYATMQDYLDLRRRPSENPPLLNATRNRLKLLGLSAGLIEGLEGMESAPVAIETPSPIAGKVMTKMIKEGDYVKTGQMLYSLVDLSSLWLIVTVYEPDLGLIRPGMKVVATSAAYPGEEFAGTVSLINHHVNRSARSAELRVEFNQPGQLMTKTEDAAGAMKHRHRLLPDMYMDARIRIDLGEQLLVPSSAVFDTGKRQYVFVERDEGLFVPREIQLGGRTETEFVVLEGLEAGDPVVIDGNFLLDSESQLKAAASGDDAEQEAGEDMLHPSQSILLPPEAGPLYAPLLADYAVIQSALAEDKLEGVTEAVERMREQIDEVSSSPIAPAESVEDYLEHVALLKTRLEEFDAEDLEGARTGFGHVSEAFAGLVAHFTPPLEQPLKMASCPMWTKSPGLWLQTGDEIVNPFMGQKMLRCGSVTGTLGDADP